MQNARIMGRTNNPDESMTTQINLTQLRERANDRIANYGGGGMGVNPEWVLALIDTAEAAIELENDIMDAIAGADLEAWNAPYRIDAPLLDKSRNRLRATPNRYEQT
jgi:hypothetical protein